MNPFRLVYERCRRRRESPEEIIAFPYSLLGNLCAAVGATLAGLLHIQVTGSPPTAGLLCVSLVVRGPVSASSSPQVLLSALAAALDALHFISWCLHVFLRWNSKSGSSSRKHCYTV